MNEVILLSMAVISGFFSLAAIQLLQHNWYKKEDAKHRYYLKRVRLNHRMKTKNPPPAPSPSGAMDWLQTIKQVPPDTLHTLIDQLGGSSMPDEEGGITETILDLVKENPELVQKFLGKIREPNEKSNDMIYEN